jgi:sugar diacid utilization regulator
MATLALDPLAVTEPASGSQPAAPGLPDVLDSFAEVIEAIDSETTVEEILQLLARKVCLLVGCTRCGVYLKHSETGLYRCEAIESSQHDADERIRRLICGTTADRLTQEILATKEPVFVRHAQNDPRTVRSIMRMFGVQSILGLPMIVREDVVGLLFLDNEQGLHPFSDEHVAVASTFAQLAGVGILQAQRASELRSNMQTIAQQNALLRHGTAIEERLTRLVLEGGTLADIAEAVADLTGKPCTIHDAAYRRVAVGSPSGVDRVVPMVLDAELRDLPEVAEALASMKPNRPAVIGPSPSAGLLHRFLVMPVVLHGQSCGYLTLMEYGSRFTALDTAVSTRATTAIAFELSVERRAAVADRHAQQALVRDLVNGLEDYAALVRRGELLGFRASAPHVIALVTPQDSHEALCIEEVEKAWAGIGQPEPLRATTVPQGRVAILIEVNESACRPAALAQAKGTVERLLSRLPANQPVLAAVSGVCSAPADYAQGHGEANKILACLMSLRGSGDAALAVLTADELGAGRLLLNMVQRDEADRFTMNTLGPLLAGANRSLDDLLVTVRVFFENGRSVRNSARYLSVHENTIRYRLGRVLDLTGLDIATDSDAQLTVQVALLILKIQGRLPATPPATAASPE